MTNKRIGNEARDGRRMNSYSCDGGRVRETPAELE